MNDYYINVIEGEVVALHRKGHIPGPQTIIDKFGNTRSNQNMNKLDDVDLALNGWYPCTITGGGNDPALADIVFDTQTMTGSGVRIPIPEVRTVTYLELRKRIVDDGVDMGNVVSVALRKALDPANPDGRLYEFLIAAQNTRDRMVELDNLDTIMGLGLMESMGTGETGTNELTDVTPGFSDRIRA